jgi:hypothetical protein
MLYPARAAELGFADPKNLKNVPDLWLRDLIFLRAGLKAVLPETKEWDELERDLLFMRAIGRTPDAFAKSAIRK